MLYLMRGMKRECSRDGAGCEQEVEVEKVEGAGSCQNLRRMHRIRVVDECYL